MDLHGIWKGGHYEDLHVFDLNILRDLSKIIGGTCPKYFDILVQNIEVPVRNILRDLSKTF